MANLTYEERVALEQQKEALRRQREDERRNGVAGVRANDTRIAANNDAMHGRAGRKWLGGEAGAVSSGDALHGQAGRKWLGGGGQQTQEPQSRISFFASDGQGRISRGDNASGEMQVRDTDVWGNDWRLRMYADQMASHDEMGQVMQAVRQKKAQQQLGLQNDIASLMKYAQGGVIPEELRQLVNRKYGFDGVKSGLLPSSGFTQNGDFALQVANGVDRNGNVQVQTIGINPFQQYSMMQTNDAAFDDNDRAALRQRLKQNYGYSDRELAAVERMRVPDLKKQYELRKIEIANREKELKIRALEEKMAKAKTAEGFAEANYKNFLNTRRLATKADVEAGIADEIGSAIIISHPEDAYNEAIRFWNNKIRNQDPATNPLGGGQGGQKPAPGSEAQPPAAPAAGGEAAPAQTATPSPSSGDDPDRIAAMRDGKKILNVVRDGKNVTMDGYEHNGKFYDADGNLMTDVEDTFDIEGAPTETEVTDEELAANPKMRTFMRLGKDGTLKRYRRDFSGVRYVRSKDRAESQVGGESEVQPPAEGQGELDFGDGKQKRTYTVGEGDDIFSISIDKGVPIKQLSELNGWDENHVLKAGDSVILPDDAIADEPTFDEKEERKRRQAAKPKSNSWKNSALFK